MPITPPAPPRTACASRRTIRAFSALVAAHRGGEAFRRVVEQLRQQGRPGGAQHQPLGRATATGAHLRIWLLASRTAASSAAASGTARCATPMAQASAPVRRAPETPKRRAAVRPDALDHERRDRRRHHADRCLGHGEAGVRGGRCYCRRRRQAEAAGDRIALDRRDDACGAAFTVSMHRAEFAVVLLELDRLAPPRQRPRPDRSAPRGFSDRRRRKTCRRPRAGSRP